MMSSTTQRYDCPRELLSTGTTDTDKMLRSASSMRKSHGMRVNFLRIGMARMFHVSRAADSCAVAALTSVANSVQYT